MSAPRTSKAIPKASAPEPSPVGPLELATVGLEQQRRGLEGAKRRHEQATAERSRTESTLADRTRVHDEAMARSRAAPEDDKLRALAVDARLARDHAEVDHRISLEQHAGATSALAASSAQVAGAVAKLELVKLEGERGSGDYERDTQRDAENIAQAFEVVLSCSRSIEARNKADAETVRQMKALGAGPEVQPRDGTTAAAMLIASLLAIGAGSDGGSPHRFRWALDPSGPGRADPDHLGRVSSLSAICVAALAAGSRKRREGIPDNGLAELQRFAEVGARCRTKAEHDAELAKLKSADAESHRQAAERAHHERLRIASEEARKPRGVQAAHPGRRPPTREAGEGESVWEGTSPETAALVPPPLRGVE